MHLYQLSTRELRTRPGRAALTFLSIVISVATVVAVLITSRVTRRAYAELYQTLSGRAALQIVARGGGNFDGAEAEKIATATGVQTVVPIVQQSAILYPEEGERSVVLVLGIDPERERKLHDYQLTAGHWFEGNVGVMLDSGFARQLGIQVGDQVKMLVQRGLIRIPVVGLITAKDAGIFNQGFVYMTIPTAQFLFNVRGKIDKAYLVLDEGADPQAVRREIAKALPEGLRVEPPPQRSTLSEESQYTMRQGLNLASSLSVVVAAFIIMNTFLMTVSERRRQLGILRAIGATRGQVTWLLLREGLWLGVLGTALGLGAGVGGAILLLRAIGGVFAATFPAIQLAAWPFVVGSVVGLGVTLLASYYPAYLAGKMSPLSSMGGVLTEDFAKPHPYAPLIGVALCVISAGIIIGSWEGYVPFEMTIPATLGLLVALVFLLPLILPPASRGIAAALGPLWGFVGQLGRRQVLRRRTRSVLTMGVLFVAIATGVGMGLTVLNEAHDVDRWMNRALQGDFFMRAMVPSFFSHRSVALPEGLEDEIRQTPGVSRVSSARFFSARAEGRQVVVASRDLGPADPLLLDLREGNPDTIREQMRQGGVVVGSVLAFRAHLQLGGNVSLDTQQGVEQLPIVGIANDYSAAGMIVFMQSDLAEKYFGSGQPDVYIINARPDARERVGQALEAIAREHGLLVQSRGEMHDIISGIKNGIVGSLWGLLIMGFIVSAFGIANTLAMNVLEQTRELGLMRVVAMTRRQLRRMILSQAIVMGLVGLIPGLGIGIIMAYITNITTKSVFGHAAAFFLRPWLLVGIFFGACVIVLIAAWIPAVRATRLKLSLALHEE